MLVSLIPAPFSRCKTRKNVRRIVRHPSSNFCHRIPVLTRDLFVRYSSKSQIGSWLHSLPTKTLSHPLYITLCSREQPAGSFVQQAVLTSTKIFSECGYFCGYFGFFKLETSCNSTVLPLEILSVSGIPRFTKTLGFFVLSVFQRPEKSGGVHLHP